MGDERFLSAIEHLLGADRVVRDPGRLTTYESDALVHFRGRPAAIAFVETTTEVQELVRLCRREAIPITPRGAGTGLSGGAVPTNGGLVIETARMRAIREVSVEDRFAVCEPGVVNAALSAAVRPHGLHFAPDPSSQRACTLGGNVAENASGPHGLKAGGTREHVLALEVVLPDGEILRLGDPRDRETGPDLLGLFLGSEGTLGIVTEITCRLVPLPARAATVLASFASMRAACEAVASLTATGVRPAALECLDERTIAIVEASHLAAGYPQDARAVLLADLDGHPIEVDAERAALERICKEHGALKIEIASDAEAAARLWRGRKGAFGAMGRLAPHLYVQDAVVPRSRLPEVLPAIVAICDEADLVISNVFHAGEGNLHPTISYDGRDPEMVVRVVEAGRRIVELCLEVGGVLSGEHGIGLEKREFLTLQFSETDLRAQHAIRDAIDPDRTMNPDKILPVPGSCGEPRQTRPGTVEVPRA